METNPPPLFINLSNIHANNSMQVKLPSPVVPSNNSDERSPLARSFSSAVKGLISQKSKLAGVSSFAGRFINAQRNRAATSNGGSGPEYGLSVQERLNRILLSNERSDEDAQLLYKMIKSNAFFEKFLEMNDNLESQSLIEVCKRIQYEKHFAHTAICKQGDPSNGKLYIVFSGELSVYIKNPDLITTQNITLEEKEKKALAEKEKEANTNSPSNRKRPSFRPPPVETVSTPRKLNMQASMPVEKEVTSATLLKEKERRSVFAPKNPKIAKGLAKLAVISKVISHTANLKKEKEKKAKDDLSENYGVVVDNIVKGGFFGERALITNLPRAATIYANTDCELLVLTKDVFMSLKSRFDKKKNRIVDFILKSIPCVDQLASGTVVEKLYYLFKEQTFEYGNTIINEGAKGEHIFLVFEGACEIVKNVKIDQSHTFKSSMSQVSPLLALGKTSFQQVMLHTIPQGTFFGEELMFEKSETYRYTVKVASPKAVVFAIQKSKFKMRFPRNTYWDMKDVYLQKLASHEKRLTDYILNKYPSQGAVIKQEEIKKMLGYNSDNGKDKDPQSKYVVVAKEPGPYYNVFKNGRPRTSYKAEMISSEQALRDDLLLSLNIPPEDGGLTSLVAKRRLVATSRSQRSYTDSSHSATRVEVEESGIMTARERIESDMIKGSEGLDAVKHVSAKQCSNTRSYGIRDPTLQFRNEYFEKINVIMPSLMVNAENSKREDVINNVNSFKVDMGKPEASLEKRYRIRMMQSSRSKEGSSHSYDNSKNVKTVRNIQTSLMSRKKRFEKKSQKLQDSFKNLVHTRSSSSEESVKAVTSATVSLNRDITSSRSTMPPRHISLVDNEYALQPQVQSARSEKKTFTICPSKYAIMSQSQTTQTRWRSKTDASKESSCQLESSQATQQTQQHQSEEEKETSLVTQSSYKKASKKTSPEDKISKILKTVQEISNSPGGMYFNREKEMEFKDYGFGDALM